MRWRERAEILMLIIVVASPLWPRAARCQMFSDVSLVLGMQALEQGDDARALGYLVPATAGSPNDTVGITARFLAAQAAANLGLWEQAGLYLQKLDTAMPEISDVIWARQAQAWRGLGAWDNAQAAWKRVLQTTKAADLRADAAFGVADAAYANGRLDEALAAYRAAAALPGQKSRDVIARLNMGIIEEARGHADAAAALYRDVAYKSHDDTCIDVAQSRLENLQKTMHVAGASWYQQLDRVDYWIRNRYFDRAKRDIEAMGRTFTNPEQKQTLAGREARMALTQRDPKSALVLLQKLTHAATGRQKLAYQRDTAAALASDGQWRASVAMYRTIAAANARTQDGRDALYRAAFLSHDGGDYKLAGQLFGEYLRRYPKDRMRDDALWYAAWSAYRLGELSRAAVQLAHIEARSAPGALRDRARYWQGRIAATQGDPNRAAAHYAKVAKAPNTYYGMWAQWRLRDLGKNPPPAAPATARADLDAGAVTTLHGAGLSPGVAPASVASDDAALASLPPTLLAQASWEEQFNTPVATDWSTGRTPSIGRAAGSTLAAATPPAPADANNIDAAAAGVGQPPAASPGPAAARALTCPPTMPPRKTALTRQDWGDDAFDWSHPSGLRILSLLRVGLSDMAASEVGALPTLPGIIGKSAVYKRARLLSHLGSLGAAFRLVAIHFPDVLEGPLQGPSRRYFELAYPTVYNELVASAARDAAVSHWLVYAIMRQESRFDARAQSAVSATGLMQIMPATGRRVARALDIKRYNDALLAEPTYNVRFGAWYTAQLLKRFSNHAALAAAGYNAGPRMVGRWVQSRSPLPTDAFIEEIPFKETRLYVKSVMSNLAIYNALYGAEDFRLPEHITIASSRPELGVDF